MRGLQTEGYHLVPSSLPAIGERPRTIAERAAAALTRITGVHVPFSSDAPVEQRAAAERQWADWFANRPDAN